MNSPEQVLVEKLKSQLRFGVGCTRYKDIYDICYLSDFAQAKKVRDLLNTYIYQDESLNIQTCEEILSRINTLRQNKRFRQRLKASKKNWLDLDDNHVFEKILAFLRSLW